MKPKRIVSFFLAILSLLCASAYVAMYLFRQQQCNGRYFGFLVKSFPDITETLLAPFSVMLGIALLVWSGRKANPVRIAIWGSAVIFLSVPTAVFFLSYLSPGRSFGNSHLLAFYWGLTQTASCVSLLTGIASCVFARALYERPENRELRLRLQPGSYRFIKKSLADLRKLEIAGLVTSDEYDKRCKEFLDKI